MQPVIVNNWLEDEAYILIEKNGYEGFADEWHFTFRDTALAPIILKQPDKKGQYELAAKIYQALKAGEEMKMKMADGKEIYIFRNYEDKYNFLTVLADYYRLTESFN